MIFDTFESRPPTYKSTTRFDAKCNFYALLWCGHYGIWQVDNEQENKIFLQENYFDVNFFNKMSGPFVFFFKAWFSLNSMLILDPK